MIRDSDLWRAVIESVRRPHTSQGFLYAIKEMNPNWNGVPPPKINWSLDHAKNWGYTLQPGHDPSVALWFATTGPPQSLDSSMCNSMCYTCGGLNHSQNYCPLRRCKQCLQYGHSTQVCLLST